MDKESGARSAQIRIAWGGKSRHGEPCSRAAFARELGVDPKSRRIYNLEGGSRPQGGLADLESLYEPLRKKGGDPRAIAIWVSTGVGAMPRPVNLDDSDDPRGRVIAGSIEHRTPPGGTRVAVSSAEQHAKSLDAEIARPMIEAALAGRADKTKTLEALRKLLLTGAVALTSLLAPQKARAASCDAWDITNKKRRKAKGKTRTDANRTASRRTHSRGAPAADPSTALTRASREPAANSKTGS